jgi:hypothetical protein
MAFAVVCETKKLLRKGEVTSMALALPSVREHPVASITA